MRYAFYYHLQFIDVKTEDHRSQAPDFTATALIICFLDLTLPSPYYNISEIDFRVTRISDRVCKVPSKVSAPKEALVNPGHL